MAAPDLSLGCAHSDRIALTVANVILRRRHRVRHLFHRHLFHRRRRAPHRLARHPCHRGYLRRAATIARTQATVIVMTAERAPNMPLACPGQIVPIVELGTSRCRRHILLRCHHCQCAHRPRRRPCFRRLKCHPPQRHRRRRRRHRHHRHRRPRLSLLRPRRCRPLVLRRRRLRPRPWCTGPELR